MAVPLTLTPGTAEPDDYGRMARITIPANSLTGSGRITTADDADADDETFTIALSNLAPAVTAGSQVRRGGHGSAAPLGAESIRAIIRARTAAIDGATGRIGGHSLRVGSARDLAASGASVAELQQAGGSSAGTGSAEAVQSRRVTSG